MKYVVLLSIAFLLTTIACGPKGSSSTSSGNSNNKNNKQAIDVILAHQQNRFEILRKILNKDKKYHIKFPGKSADKHALGVGYGKMAWAPVDAPGYNKMVQSIAASIKDLAKDFPNRIHFGMIGDYKLDGSDCDSSTVNAEGVPGLQGDGTFMIHVWGANAGNFNEPNGGSITGGGQASCFASQRPGAFGISTMPSTDENTLLAPDKLLSLY